MGFLIGAEFNGTIIPFLLGTAACAVALFIGVALTEPGACSPP